MKKLFFVAALLASTCAAHAAVIFNGEHAIGIDSAVPWSLDFYLGGALFATNGYPPGDYSLDLQPDSDQWITRINTNIPGGTWVNQNGFYTVGPASSAPEASTWVMMLTGFAGMGYAAVRRARVARVLV